MYSDGVSTHTLKVEWGELYAIPEEHIPAEREGYVFDGWYDLEEYGKQYVSANGTCKEAFADKKSLVLYPQFIPLEYTLYLDYGVAEATEEYDTVCSDETFPSLPVCVPKGEYHYYVFQGWYTEENCGGEQVCGANGASKLTFGKKYRDMADENRSLQLYAGYKIAEYSVKFHSKNGELLKEETAKYGAEVLSLAPTHEGTMEIVDWTRGYGGSVVFTGMLEGNLNLYVMHYKFTVTFDGTLDVVPAPVVLTEGESTFLPEVSREGYTLAGWADEKGNVHTGDYCPTWNVTLRAKWDANKYKVLFDAKGGSLSVVEQLVEYKSKYSLPVPMKTGYTFAGWADENGVPFTDEYGDSLIAWELTARVKLYAQWEAVGYTVQFYSKSGGKLLLETVGKYGQSIYDIAPTQETGEGDIVDWSKTIGGDSYEGAIVGESKFYVLHYGYLVTFDYGYGTTEVERVMEGESVELPFVERTGYTFLGWFDNKGVEVTADITPEKSVTVTAKWSENSYEVTLIPNGGILSGAATYTVKYTKLTQFPKPVYTTYAEYNRFDGWYLDEDLTDWCSPFALEENPRDVTLYAAWDLCTVYTSIDASPYTTAGRVILDWSKETDTNLLNHTSRFVVNGNYNHINIGNTTEEVVFIGNSSKTFTNLCLDICNFANGQRVDIHFVDFNFTGNAGNVVELYNDSGAYVVLNVKGYSTVSTSAASGNVFNLKGAELLIKGDGELTVKAGNGANATVSSGDGGNGGIGISATRMSVTMSGKVSVYGGHGGNGKEGAQGAQGDTGTKGTYAFSTNASEGKNGGKGGMGYTGGDGGDGGDGGVAVSVLVYSPLPANVTLVSGNAGAGADGGKGGKGGTGGQGAVHNGNGVLIVDTSRHRGLKGGTGGTGGTGGDRGFNGSAGKASANVGSTCSNSAGKASTATPKPGLGGDGGDGGARGYVYNHSWDHGTWYGSAGGKGATGQPGI